MRLVLILPFCAPRAFADVDRALDTHILPAHAELVIATQALADTAQTDCTPQAAPANSAIADFV
ncbi:hypothetical protein [uncultured Tateyamaria sp.]|uniref:hypothetical protein n=1 Tax=uncultured Tateyamaria sp. TaxID=455651 RepID=UPI00262D4838|nr:hypothetical protein [uncultured Tateyamaria sp.]